MVIFSRYPSTSGKYQREIHAVAVLERVPQSV